MTQPFVFDEKANSPDLTDAEVEGAIATSCAEDIRNGLASETACLTCAKAWVKERHAKRFRYPHFYSRVTLTCPEGHTKQVVFQTTWLWASR